LRRERDRRTRIAFLTVAVAAAVFFLPGSQVSSQTPDPMRHEEGAVSGPIVESPEAMAVTSQIQCFCGGCVNQTLHDCTCGLAARERRSVAEALASGRTPDALIAAYIAEHGVQVRIVPEKRGLNLIGWWIPFAAAASGLAALLLVLQGWRRRGIALEDAARQPETEQRYRDRLEREIREFDP
jgi:cytochrome c-type biogenesis protein CcmH/NrfF